MLTARVFILGFVQGVGFRSFVKNKAKEFGLTGWVRNLPDNRVEALFQGKKEAIDKMIAICKKGPFLSEVRDISVEWEKGAGQFEDFKVLV